MQFLKCASASGIILLEEPNHFICVCICSLFLSSTLNFFLSPYPYYPRWNILSCLCVSPSCQSLVPPVFALTLCLDRLSFIFLPTIYLNLKVLVQQSFFCIDILAFTHATILRCFGNATFIHSLLTFQLFLVALCSDTWRLPIYIALIYILSPTWPVTSSTLVYIMYISPK